MTKRVLEVGVGTAQQSQYHYLPAREGRTVFVNIDRRLFPHTHVQVDLNEGLPFKDQTFNAVFSAHCVEHLSFDTAHQLLREIHRVLKPFGTVLLLLPDFAYWVRRYQQEGWTEAVWTNIFGQQLYHGDFHLSGWDSVSLSKACLTAGFHSVAAAPGRTEDEMKIFASKQEAKCVSC